MSAGKVPLWTGYVLSTLVVLALIASGVMKLMGRPEVEEMLGQHLGYGKDLFPIIGGIEIACALIYAIPRTATLGAVLLTGFLGGAVASHVRVNDPYYVPLALGIVVWLALYLRDTRLRRLLPLQ